MKPNPLIFGAALVALYFYTKKANAATPEEPTGPGPEPKPEEPEEKPTEPEGPLPPLPNEPPNDGEHPRKEPRQGFFYQVVPGDMLSKIVVRAGLPAKAHLVTTKHPQNDWIKKIRQEDGTLTLKLWPRYEPAYKGEYLQRSTGSLPVVYIPTLAEYEALK
jgi:hypothetical protein